MIDLTARELWLQERKTGIGGSDASVVLGVNPYKTVRELWLEKTGLSQDPEKESGPILRGRFLEPVAADQYAERTGRKIRRQPMRRHSEHHFMIGNVDRQILAVNGVASTGILEVKCPGLRSIAKVKAHGLPDYMTVQLMHYLAVYEYSWGSFALFNAENWDLIYFDLEADEHLIATIIEREQEFWTEYVEPQVEPPTEVEKAFDIPKIEGELTVVNTEDWQRMASDLREARDLKQAAETLEESAKTQIQERMHRDELHAVEVDGLARFYYRYQAGTTKWKETAEAIAREANLKTDAFLVKGDGFTRFTPYFLSPEEDPNG